MASLDLFIVNVAFDDIGRDFRGVSTGNLSWVLNGYAIVYAALLVPLGRLADRSSRKVGFLLGLGVFTAASAACAVSTDLPALVAFRLVQAVGAAALTPTSLGLLLPVFAPDKRAGAVRVWAATGALAAAFGPVAGGLLVELSWRWVFLVNLPIGLAALLAAVRFVPDSRDPVTGPLPDLMGAVLVAVSVGSVALALVEGGTWGWGSARTVAGFVVSAATAALFWKRSLRHPVPVVEPALLRVRAFAWSNVTSLVFSVAFAGNLLVGILWMQRGWGYSALRTGLGVAPGPLMVPVFALVGGLVVRRGLPVGALAGAGCALFAAAGLLTAYRIGLHPAYATELLPSQLLGGMGVGLALPTILSAATADLPGERAATGSAVVSMARQIGSVLGVSVVVALIGTPLTFTAAHTAFQHAWIACAAASVVAAVAAIGMTPRRPLLVAADVRPAEALT
jgi:EmrB/QacA subfamily drug resistance transporter